MAAPAITALLGAHKAASGAWTPASFSGLIAWYKADVGVTSSGSPALVSQWDDQSGNGYHLANSGSGKPTTGADTINGLNVITFDGSTKTYLDYSGISQAQVYAVYVVTYNNRPSAGGSFALDHVPMWDDGNPQMFTDGDANWWLSSDQGGNNWKSTAASGSPEQLVAIFDGASSTIYQNGTQQGTGDAGTSGFTGNFRLGAYNSLYHAYDGQVGEFVIQAGTPSGTDLTNWNTYCSRWGL